MIFYCIPTHNEEKTVGVVLWKLRHVMAEFPRDYQILVADDASSDGSADVLEPYRRVLPLLLIRNASRRGYAATLEMLLREAVRLSRYPRRDVIVVLQADFTDDPGNASILLRRIESGADIAAGGPVTDATRRGFVERLARRYARRLLRRFEWPANADPLNGLTAYRLSCVKRALAECDGERLLAWEGLAANAALLRAAIPHARRIECAEIVRHPERVQRRRRLRPLEMIGHVRQFAAGTTPPGLVPPARLVPDEVRGDLSVLQGPPANRRQVDDRQGSGSKPRRDGRARPKRSGQRKGGDAAARPAGKAERPAGKTAKKAATRKSSRTGSKDAARSTRQQADSPSGRGSRGRRGGRGSGRSGRTAKTHGAVSVASDTEDIARTAEPAEPDDNTGRAAAGHAGEQPEHTATAGVGKKKSGRRRRGRRGGKGRGGRRRKAGTNDATDQTGGTPTNSQTDGNG